MIEQEEEIGVARYSRSRGCVRNITVSEDYYQILGEVVGPLGAEAIIIGMEGCSYKLGGDKRQVGNGELRVSVLVAEPGDFRRITNDVSKIITEGFVGQPIQNTRALELGWWVVK